MCDRVQIGVRCPNFDWKMTEKELINAMIEHLEADAEELHRSGEYPQYPALTRDMEEAQEVYREKITVLKECDSLQQVRVLAQAQIPCELEHHRKLKDHDDAPIEALISISNRLGSFLSQVDENDLLNQPSPGMVDDVPKSPGRGR
jgi:hypothetical protein